MGLLDLPPELFEKVVAALARVVPFHELVRLRAVSRTFAGDIDNKLLAKTSVEDFDDRTHQRKFMRASPRSRGFQSLLLDLGPEDEEEDDPSSLTVLSPDIKGYLLGNIETYILNHVDDVEMVMSELPSFINKVTNRLLEFAPAGADRSALRKDYLNALVYSLVLTNKVAPRTMFEKKPLMRNFRLRRDFEDSSRSELERERKHVSSAGENVNDMSAAAAAVGDLVTTRHYISQSAEVIDWFPKYFAGFGNPLVTATCNKNVEVLEYLLTEANNELANRNFSHRKDNSATRCGPVTETINSAIRDAVQNGNLEAVVVLFAFLPRCNVGLPAHMKSPSHYFADAMRWGHVDLITWLFDRWNISRNEPFYRDILVAGLRLAVEHGHTNVVRHVLDHGFVDSCTADSNPIPIAVKHGHRAIIQLALDRGAQLSMHDIVSALNGSLPLLMTQFLLDRNVPLTSIIKDEHGATTIISIILTIENLCCKSIYVPFGDRNPIRGKEKALALILLAREMRQQIPELMMDNCVELKKVFDRLVKRCLILPTEPIPYLQIVRELHSWMEWGDGREWARCNV